MERPRRARTLAFCLLTLCCLSVAGGAQERQTPALVPKFPLKPSGLELTRRTQAGAFLDVLGRKSAVYGYEHRQLEAWAYPLQILDRFELSFRLEGYPLEIRGADTAALINVRPEATTVTYSHAAFTVRQIIYAPLSEPGVVMLFDIDSALPLSVEVSFRPRLRLMWPAGSPSPGLHWDEREQAYLVTEETGRFAGVVGSPAARDVSVMPYQEEPRDAPARFRLEAPAEALRTHFVPLVIAGSTRGRDDALAAYRRLLQTAGALYEGNAEHYRRLLEETTTVETPDARLDEAFRWAKVGIDKGLVENPLLGTGLVAGFRTAGESERPGFAWFFGRDALWTALAVNSYGDFQTTRAALDFLKKFQRADGKIPHEISQSASLVPWFTDYPYAWASADATPLYIIAHADLLRASGDVQFTRSHWDAIRKAYDFSRATDTDGDGLIENTQFGHGWVEGGALYPPHEEIYLQGLWVAALRAVAEMAARLGERDSLGADAAARAEATRKATEETFWLPERGFYAFATNLPRAEPRKAEPGPHRAARQTRMDELDKSKLIDEETVMPAVPLWWGVLEDSRAQLAIDGLGGGRLATDWGARLVSETSRLYDPLSYHHGSVWPLFTGWASVGAYRYGRPQVGWQALMSNVLLKRQNALGYVTELLSGDFHAAFGRSSHHQVWSEAMIVSPLMRGLLGLESGAEGAAVGFAPQLPPDWGEVEARGVAAGDSLYDFTLTREDGELTILVGRRAARDAAGATRTAGGPVQTTGGAARAATSRVRLAPALPLDAAVRFVRVNGRPAKFQAVRAGDVQRVEVFVEVREQADVVISYEEGTDVYVVREAPAPGARSEGLRVLRSRAEGRLLRLLLEGRGGFAYDLRVVTPREIVSGPDYEAEPAGAGEYHLTVPFPQPGGAYVRKELLVPLGGPR